jgi:hypothetical protein
MTRLIEQLIVAIISALTTYTAVSNRDTAALIEVKRITTESAQTLQDRAEIFEAMRKLVEAQRERDRQQAAPVKKNLQR